MISTISLVIATGLLTVIFIFVVFVLAHRHFPHRIRLWLCEHLGWHDGEWPIDEFDGVNVHTRCPTCGKKVMLDSQGNWF